MPRPIRASIDRSAILHNYRLARARAGGARAWAVVKANGYGHGLLNVASALGDEADGFALLDLAEAEALRAAGYRQPILLLEGFFQPEDLDVVGRLGLTTAIHRTEQLDMLAAARLPAPVPVWLKLNTGMNRLGLDPASLPAVLGALAGNPAVGPVTVMAHFAEADGGRGIAWQMARLQAALAAAGWRGPLSLANSAALLRYPETAADWVRPGIMLYGGSPFADEDAVSLGLRPAMTLESEIIAVQSLAPGERVGYGGLFEATRPTRIGIVACGYADGYPRHAPGGTPIRVDGALTQTVGRVSMDMLACDLTELPASGVGSRVTLWGEGLAADTVAAAAGTISYELFCALARRVPVSVR